MGLPITMPAFFDAGGVLPFFRAGNGKPPPANRTKKFAGHVTSGPRCLVLIAKERKGALRGGNKPAES